MKLTLFVAVVERRHDGMHVSVHLTRKAALEAVAEHVELGADEPDELDEPLEVTGDAEADLETRIAAAFEDDQMESWCVDMNIIDVPFAKPDHTPVDANGDFACAKCGTRANVDTEDAMADEGYRYCGSDCYTEH